MAIVLSIMEDSMRIFLKITRFKAIIKIADLYPMIQDDLRWGKLEI